MTDLLGLAILGFISTFGLSVVSPTLPLYVERFGVSYAGIGAFFSAYSFTWAVLQLYTGHLADRYGCKRFVLAGLLIYGLFAVACGLALSFGQLLAFRLLQGVGLGLFGPAMLGLAAGFEEKGKVFAFYRSAQTAGTVLAPTVGGYVGRADLAYPFFISAAAAALALITIPFLRGERRGGGMGASFLAALKVALSRRGFMLLCLATFLAEMGYVALGITVPLVGGEYDFATETIGLIMAAYYVVFTLTQVPIGFLSEHVKRRGLVIACALLASLAYFWLFAASTPWAMALGLGLLGVGVGTIFVQATAWAAEMAPVEAKSLYMATFDGIIDLSFVIMPLIVGAVALQGVQLPFLLCGLLLPVSAAVFVQITDGGGATWKHT
jgi:DHA1 family multidrug resistance protein-like MFS transporter